MAFARAIMKKHKILFVRKLNVEYFCLKNFSLKYLIGELYFKKSEFEALVVPILWVPPMVGDFSVVIQESIPTHS